MKSVPMLPVPMDQALLQLGRDIKDARRRRRITMQLLAERAMISRPTLQRIEQGDASCSIGDYASVLFSLGLAHRLAKLAHISIDSVGQQLEEDRLPQRVRMRKFTDD